MPGDPALPQRVSGTIDVPLPEGFCQWLLRLAGSRAKLKKMASASSFAESPFIFPPSKDRLWIKEPSVTIKHFHAALDALGIRRRRQYDARHTYATMYLMAGMNPAFIARQVSSGTTCRCCSRPMPNG